VIIHKMKVSSGQAEYQRKAAALFCEVSVETLSFTNEFDSEACY